MRIFALSDLHVDYNANMNWVSGLPAADYTADALLVAGDVSHEIDLFSRALEALRARFRTVFFVPGNHDLWLRSGLFEDSLAKFRFLLQRCGELGVETTPARLPDDGPWIVPLQSWYIRPEEPGGSLYVPKQGEDPKLGMWADNRAVRWPVLIGQSTAAAYLLSLNNCSGVDAARAPVISFSHFLPRRELMFWTQEEFAASGLPPVDPQPKFNFSRVAGCCELDDQIRALGSALHVYGHQHRNRRRTIDGVQYVSHGLGYPRERERGRVQGIAGEPLLIWDGGIALPG